MMRAPSNPLFRSWMERELMWLAETGVGFFPVTGAPYDQSYFDKYVEYAKTELGRQLTQERCAMVRRHFDGEGILIDVGIGAGQFVEAFDGAFGFDINPAGIAWLVERKRFLNPYLAMPEAATFWDSFEHIHDPAPILANVGEWAFMAIPVFRDLSHVQFSRHFRPDEHCWYFTESGLLKFMAHHGFGLVERTTIESDLGRDGIVSFAFQRGEPRC